MLTVVNALLLTMADGQEPMHGWMTVGADGRITGLGPGPAPPDPGPTAAGEVLGEVLDVGGKIVAPGFVSAHSHLHTSGLRGLAAGETLYPWVRANNEILLGAADEDLFWCVLHGCLDFLDSGITSAYNFVLNRAVWLYDPAGRDRPAQVREGEFVTGQFDAAAASGLRVLSALSVDDDAFGAAAALDEFDAMAAAVGERTPPEGFLGVSVYGSVQWAGSERTAELEAEVMARHGVTNQAHFVPFANLRAGLYSQRAAHHRASALLPREMLRLHTLGSAEVLGVADRVGSLEVGKFADFLVVDPRHPDTGPIWDVHATYVLACGPRNLRSVYVGGRCRSTDGRSHHPLAEVAGPELHTRMARAARARGLPPPITA